MLRRSWPLGELITDVPYGKALQNNVIPAKAGI